MATYQVMIEGQTIPLPEELAKDDASVKRALVPYYPEAANAMITRVEKDGVVTITVVKRAGTKGYGFDDLIACPGGKNPAMALYERLEHKPALDALEELELDLVLEDVIREGEEQGRRVHHAFSRLSKAVPQAAPAVVEGF